jgi:hypothetical protein
MAELPYQGEMDMSKTIALIVLVLALTLAVACGGKDDVVVAGIPETDHMVAQATITAHYIDAALKAGMTEQQINVTLGQIASNTVIDEFWISDEGGRIDFTNVPGLTFEFPTDPSSGSQAAPFADLLLGGETVVVQDAQFRDADGALFQYVGVAGVDQPRIVQVGFDRGP